MYNLCPNYDFLLPKCVEKGIENLNNYYEIITPGTPIQPMLAYPEKNISEVFKRYRNTPILCEYKYDGERAQVFYIFFYLLKVVLLIIYEKLHYNKNSDIKVFSRNKEDTTNKYPDIIDCFKNYNFDAHNIESFIIDCEITAYDCNKKKVLPFQTLSTRKRKHVDNNSISVDICIFVFDILYLNGKETMTKKLFERKKILFEKFNEIENKFFFTTSKVIKTEEEIKIFLDEAIRDGQEGIMIKMLESDYEIIKRSHSWLKIKKDYIEGKSEGLDLIVIGGYYGNGKRTGLYGGYLLACYDEDTDTYQTICKVGSGIKDEELKRQYEFFNKNVLEHKHPSYVVKENMELPDKWFKPCKIWEIMYADFSLSPVHSAAYGIFEDGKGISLRFPRFVRERNDKNIQQSNKLDYIINLFNNK